MSETKDAHPNKLICLRFAAECKNLAAHAPEADLRAHFLQLSDTWLELVVCPLRSGPP